MNLAFDDPATLTEVPLLEFLSYDIYKRLDYDGKCFTRADAEARANHEAALAKRYREVLLANGGKIFVKLTAGQRAGTIGYLLLDNMSVSGARWNCTSLAELPVKVIEQSRYAKDCGYFEVQGRLYIQDYKNLELVVDEKGVIQEFTTKSPFVLSAKPVVLLDYAGPTVYKYSRKVIEKGAENTIKDRYDRVVRKGDVVIASGRPSGTLFVGKITEITNKRSVRIRHIGADKETVLVGIRDDQVLLLDDDLQRVLMFKKLQML